MGVLITMQQQIHFECKTNRLGEAFPVVVAFKEKYYHLTWENIFQYH
jgi:hypothetical protein